MSTKSEFASLDSELHERVPSGMTVDEVIEGAGQPSAVARKIDTSGNRERPTFPHWVMEGTSLYTGLVEPICQVNSKHPELVFMPAMVHLLNTLALQAWPEYQFVIPTVNLGIITPPGQFFKSSSVETAFDYFKTMGLSDTFSPHMQNADGRTIVYCVGSLEGLGLQMARLGNVRAILFNDELGKFISKASIQASSMTAELLTLYESGLFQNILKNKRESFSHAAKSYCCCWMWATTNDGFPQHWGKLSGTTAGLNDRMFFLIGPEHPRPLSPHIDVDVTAGALQTKELINTAIRKQTIPVDTAAQRAHMQGITESRALSLLLKFAFGFAVDLGRERIDGDCFKRARALVDYRAQAIKFLAPVEAETRQGLLQQRMVGLLEKNRGQMLRRDWRKELHLERYGTAMAFDAEIGLIKAGRIAVSDGTPKIVCLLKEAD